MPPTCAASPSSTIPLRQSLAGAPLSEARTSVSPNRAGFWRKAAGSSVTDATPAPATAWDVGEGAISRIGSAVMTGCASAHVAKRKRAAARPTSERTDMGDEGRMCARLRRPVLWRDIREREATLSPCAHTSPRCRHLARPTSHLWSPVASPSSARSRPIAAASPTSTTRSRMGSKRAATPSCASRSTGSTPACSSPARASSSPTPLAQTAARPLAARRACWTRSTRWPGAAPPARCASGAPTRRSSPTGCRSSRRCGAGSCAPSRPRSRPWPSCTTRCRTSAAPATGRWRATRSAGAAASSSSRTACAATWTRSAWTSRRGRWPTRPTASSATPPRAARPARRSASRQRRPCSSSSASSAPTKASTSC